MGCFRSKVFTGVTLQHSSVHAWMVLSAHATGACSLQLVIVIRRSYLSWSSCLPPVLDPPAVLTPLLLSPLGYSLDAYGLSLVSSECCCWAGDLFIRVVSWSRSELLSFSYHFNIFSFVTTSITVSGEWFWCAAFLFHFLGNCLPAGTCSVVFLWFFLHIPFFKKNHPCLNVNKWKGDLGKKKMEATSTC
jgi:hypothetical protein